VYLIGNHGAQETPSGSTPHVGEVGVAVLGVLVVGIVGYIDPSPKVT
jgi:hypothetical protein